MHRNLLTIIPALLCLSACSGSTEGTANAASPAILATETLQPVPGAEDTPEWVLIDENETGRHFIEKAARERANLVATDAWALVRIEFAKPQGEATSLEGMYQINCDQGLQRYLVAETFDANGYSLDHDNQETPWMRPKKGTIAETYQKAACIPMRSDDG